MENLIQNPVLRGFNPDPMMFKDDEKYYIVVSTFEWLPGLRVFSSKNLVEWRFETSILGEKSGIDLRGNQICCSIWAPYVSYHNGTYYVVYTNVNQTKVPYKDVDNFIITSENIHGPWSDPVYINSSGFDPSIFFDDDGKAYFINEIWDYRRASHNKSAGVVMQEMDPVTFDLLGEPRKIFDGTTAQKTEAPQIYKRNGYYYLFTAEGGTEKGHQETVARSRDLWGPYEVDPQTPLITSSDDPSLPLQCCGHASLVETDGGEWYIAHLCTRPLPSGSEVLGRETALQKVEWTEKGWLRLAQGGHHPLLQVSAPTGVGVAESTDSDIFGSFDDPFTSEDLDTQKWSFLRKFPDETWLRATSCGLEISGGQSPQSAFDQHLIATRQTAFHCKASVDMEYKPVNYLQMAGMTLYLDIANYVLLMVTANDDDSTSVVLQKCVAGDFSEVTRVPVRPGKYRLSIEMEDERARFRVTEVDISSVDTGEASEPKALGELDIAFLSGGFTGNFIGVDAIDMYRRNSSMARFTNFEYTVL